MALADLKIYSDKAEQGVGGEWVQEELLVDNFKSVSNKISRLWQVGMYENLPLELNHNLAAIEVDIEQIWFGCRIGKNSIKDFKSILNDWIQFHKQIVKNNNLL